MGRSVIYSSWFVYRLAMRILYGGDYRARLRRVCELIGEQDGRVLELCFGDIGIAKHCRQRGLSWVGLDINEAFVAKAVRRGFEARQADLTAGDGLPACDVCVMMGSLYHFEPQLKELFARIKGASRRFVLSEPVRNWTHAGGLRRQLALLMTRVGGREESFRFTEESLTQTLERLKREVGFDYRVVSASRDLLVEVVWSS